MSFGIETEKKFEGLERRFPIPPFSVLRSTNGWWKKRKLDWLKLGIKSEVGRNHNLLNIGDLKIGSDSNWDHQSSSIFDPVLCELVYRWFTIKGGSVLDPFAGGSVRGIVASFMGLSYHGIELRSEQVEENYKQAEKICEGLLPEWVCGDSADLLTTYYPPDTFDFIFTCPPYGDLEKYSDDPSDLSNMNRDEFLDKYYVIIEEAVSKLKNNRFAVMVVGNYRDKMGFFHHLVGDTVRAFEDAGMRLYNDAVVVLPVGTWCIRVSKNFNGPRKMGNLHQNVLVFYKGDPRKIKTIFGEFKQRGSE